MFLCVFVDCLSRCPLLVICPWKITQSRSRLDAPDFSLITAGGKIPTLVKKKENACLFVFLVFSVWNKSHSATCVMDFGKSSKLLLTHGSWKDSTRSGLKVEGKSQNMRYFLFYTILFLKAYTECIANKTSRALSPFPGCVSLPSPPDEWTSPLTAPGFYRQTAAFASNLCREQLSQWRGSPLAVTRKGLTNQRYVRPRGGGV